MKIIVDEMPKYPFECPLVRMKNGDWFCSKYESECDIDMCDMLKPITDYVLEEHVTENITKRIPLKDTNANR